MNEIYEKYLSKIEKYLNPLPTSEKTDILKEVKSSILEMENEGMLPDEILKRLGDPKILAKSYLGDFISNGNGNILGKFFIFFTFCTITGFTGIILVPMFVVFIPTFFLSGAFTILCSIFKVIDVFLPFNFPFLENVGIKIGNIQFNPIFESIFMFIVGIILIFISIISYKLFISYCKKVSLIKEKLL